MESTRDKEPEWKKYEKKIYQQLLEILSFDEDIVCVQFDQKLEGKMSGVERQIDVLVTVDLGPFSLRIIVDCKSYTKNIDVKGVEEFAGMVKDVGASKGIMVTTSGYSEAAVKRIHNDPSDIDLVISKPAELKEYQDLVAMPYAGRFAVLLTAPHGWVIDTRSNYAEEARQMNAGAFPIGLAFLYPIGLGLETAMNHDCFIYCNIAPGRKIDELIEEQRKNHPDLEPQMLPASCDDFELKARRYTSAKYNTVEDTLFIDYGDFVFWAVLLTPLDKTRKTEKARRVLSRLFKTAIPFDLAGTGIEPSENSN